MRTRRLLVTVGIVGALAASLGACSSSTTASTSSSASASSAAPTLASSAAPRVASPASSGTTGSSPSPEVTAWCTDYYARTDKMQGSAASQEAAKVGLDQIQPIKKLWETASAKGYITASELAASERVLQSIADVLTLIANGSATDSAEVAKAEDDLNAATAKEQKDVTSVTQKFAALCQGTTPSASASPTVSP